MNLFMPQCRQALIELMLIASVERQIISPGTSKPIIGCVQDSILGAYLLTADYVRINGRDVMDLLMYTQISEKKLKSINPNKIYTGQEVYSFIIPPKINAQYKKDGKMTFKCVDGVVEPSSRITKDQIGNSRNSIIHQIWDQYKHTQAKYFLNNTRRLTHRFVMTHGFSVGVKDIIIEKNIKKQVEALIATKKLEANHLITEMENNTLLRDFDLFETSIAAEVNVLRDNASKLALVNLSITNSFNTMVTCMSKGSILNIGQVMTTVGQQDIEGKRVQKKLNGRTLPHYFQNDDGLEARGYVSRCYLDGLRPQEFFFHTMSGRQGLIDTAIKSVSYDTEIFIVENEIPKYIKIGEWIDDLININKNNVKCNSEKTELLQLDTKTYISTMDYNGNVSWGNITHVTRHLPTDIMYKIKTKTGRHVTVTDSKSLLIWNEEKQIFEHRLTSDVKVNDIVPITKFLPKPDFKINNNLLAYDNCVAYYENMIGDNNEQLLHLIEYYIYFYGQLNDDVIEIPFKNQHTVNQFSILCSRVNIFSIIGELKLILNINEPITNIGLECLSRTLIDKIKSFKYNTQHDVVLDEISEIVKVDKKDYPKVYDLTIPDTLNFGLANGLQVVDTAETGYIQRRLVKALEDYYVAYDGTVRNAKDVLLQCVYGDNGCNPMFQAEQKIRFVLMNDAEVTENYSFTKEERKEYDVSDEKNKMLLYKIFILRDKLRTTQIKSVRNYLSLKDTYNTHVNISRLIETYKTEQKKNKNKEKKESELDFDYVVNTIDTMLSHKYTPLMKMSEKQENDKTSFKYRDERISKLVFEAVLYDYLSPKKCMIEYKFSKETFGELISDVITKFNEAVVEPGEMVGVIAAQSIGEPTSQCTLNTFHHTGIAEKSSGQLGVPRIKEIMSLARNPKTPRTTIYIDEKYNKDKIMCTRITSYIKYTTIEDIVGKLEVIYDPYPNKQGSIMEKDEVDSPFVTITPTKTSCQTEIKGLSWLIRMKINKEKMLEREVTLLDIKSKFCEYWANRYVDTKGMKKEDRLIMERITKCTILSNYDNSDIPTVHIRLQMNNFDKSTFMNFVNLILRIKLKGIDGITGVKNLSSESFATIKNDGSIKNENKYVIYADGTNLGELRYIHGIDLDRTVTNNVVEIFKYFGIEAAKSALIKEYKTVLEANGGSTNYQHWTVLVDSMTISNIMTSIDRHGMGRLDIDPLTQASFERPVDKFFNGAVFREPNYMKGVSPRIMLGQAIKGGTGLCHLIMNTKMLESTEFPETEDAWKKGQKYKKITNNKVIDDVLNKTDDDAYLPD